MDQLRTAAVDVLLIGVIATAVMDVGGLILQQWGRMPLPNYALVGRWIGYMPRGCFHHESIAAAAAIPGERVIGWTAHYLIGTAFAAVLIALCGMGWTREPTPGPALLVGLGSVVAPYLLMQPAMGAGVAGSRTPRPGATRVRSLINHSLFALGLYLAGWATQVIRAH